MDDACRKRACAAALQFYRSFWDQHSQKRVSKMPFVKQRSTLHGSFKGGNQAVLH